MVPTHIPNFNITHEQLMNAETLADYLNLKFTQLGVMQSELFEMVGEYVESCSQLVTFFRQKHAELYMETYGFDEQEKLQQLCDAMEASEKGGAFLKQLLVASEEAAEIAD